MHFWIDKRNQGCRISGRRFGPTYVTGRPFSAVYPKLMVTPVHRFQSIESAIGRTARQNRGPAYYHARFLERTRAEQNVNEESNQNAAFEATLANNVDGDDHHNSNNLRSSDGATHRNTHTVLPRNSENTQSAAKIKCFIWASAAAITFSITTYRFYYYGERTETIAFCYLLVLIFIVGGVASLYEAITPNDVQNAFFTAKVKCGVWVLATFVTFSIVGLRFYFYGGFDGNALLPSLLILMLLGWGAISLCEAIKNEDRPNNNNTSLNFLLYLSGEQSERQAGLTEVSVPNATPIVSTELPDSAANGSEVPPPPYHIAIMLPTQQDEHHSIQHIRRDSPPPTYEKAVT